MDTGGDIRGYIGDLVTSSSVDKECIQQMQATSSGKVSMNMQMQQAMAAQSAQMAQIQATMDTMRASQAGSKHSGGGGSGRGSRGRGGGGKVYPPMPDNTSSTAGWAQ